jgi:glycosyltransferase involved in cell wall biosynthesis
MVKRLTFFGSYYPEFRRVGTVSTGLVGLLAGSPKVDSIRVFAQVGAGKPRNLDSKVSVTGSWKLDDPLSLIRTFLLLLKVRDSTDSYLLNTYPTAFGVGRIANALGLMIGPMLGFTTGKAVMVYMHNFAESQDLTSLGYSPSRVERIAIWAIEWAILRLTITVVPLVGQADIVESKFGIRPVVHPLIYLEGVASYDLLSVEERRNLPSRKGEKRDILLIGNWGPQKDLESISEVIKRIQDDKNSVTVTIAGPVHERFPDYIAALDDLRNVDESKLILFVGEVREEQIAQLVLRHRLIVLPYRASGGYSGVLNLAAFFDVPAVCADLPQLREQADNLSARVAFTPVGDVDQLVRSIKRLLTQPEQTVSIEALEIRRGKILDSITYLVDQLARRRGRGL